MQKRKRFSIILALVLALSSCSIALSESDNRVNITATDEADMFTNRDRKTDYDASTAVRIQLNGDSISCNSNSVRVTDTTATITGEGTYILSGTLNDGMIVVNAGDKDKVQLVLDNVSIHSATSAPLYILEADKVFITLAPDSVNTLSNGGGFVPVDESNIDGAIFSKQDLTINGSGSLDISSPAGHGVVCKDDLVITGGTLSIASGSHGLQGKDSVRIADADITINSGKDGIHAENSNDEELGFVYIASGSLHINAQGDGISAGSTLQVLGGEFSIVSGGGSENATRQRSAGWGMFGGGFNRGGGMQGGKGERGGSFTRQSAPAAGSAPDMGNPPDAGNAPGMKGVPDMGNIPSPGGFSDRNSLPDTDGASADEGDGSTSMKGIKSGADMLLAGGSFTINSADDSLHSNSRILIQGGTFELASGDDGMHADEALQITGGTILITESYEGIEALHLIIEGGDITLTATDDGLNAAGGTDSSGFGGPMGNDRFGGRGGFGGGSSSNGTMLISGGNLYINASGDGIDSNGSVEITGGFIVVCGPTQGDTSILDYDTTGVITGGTFIGTGAYMMPQTFSDSEQGVITLRVGNQSAGAQITIADASGKVLLTHTPELPFAMIIMSSPELVKGETYAVTIGDASGEFAAN